MIHDSSLWSFIMCIVGAIGFAFWQESAGAGVAFLTSWILYGHLK